MCTVGSSDGDGRSQPEATVTDAAGLVDRSALGVEDWIRVAAIRTLPNLCMVVRFEGQSRGRNA